MRGIAAYFFTSASLYVLAGMLFGIVMAANHDHTLAGAHAHLNLVGWVTMALFGIYYHLVPQAGGSRLAMVHFIVATIGLWLMIPGIAIATEGGPEGFAIAGSLATVASMVIFVIQVIRTRATA